MLQIISGKFLKVSNYIPIKDKGYFIQIIRGIYQLKHV